MNRRSFIKCVAVIGGTATLGVSPSWIGQPATEAVRFLQIRRGDDGGPILRHVDQNLNQIGDEFTVEHEWWKPIPEDLFMSRPRHPVAG